MKPPLQRVLDKLAASGPGAFIECGQEELDAYAAYQARKVPTNLPFSVSAAINEREMRMRCLELAVAVDHKNPGATFTNTIYQDADRLMKYVMTGTYP